MFSTGQARPARTTVESWSDPSGGLLRIVRRVDGRVQSDDVQPCRTSCALSLGETYWPVDTALYTREPATGTFHGRPVIWLDKRQPEDVYPDERIGLDPVTHQPVVALSLIQGKIIWESWIWSGSPTSAQTTSRLSFQTAASGSTGRSRPVRTWRRPARTHSCFVRGRRSAGRHSGSVTTSGGTVSKEWSSGGDSSRRQTGHGFIRPATSSTTTGSSGCRSLARVGPLATNRARGPAASWWRSSLKSRQVRARAEQFGDGQKRRTDGLV